MMQLRTLSDATWQVVAEVDHRGKCPVEDELNNFAKQKRTLSVAAGVLALWMRIPNEGPNALPTESYHCVDKENDIYEFIKGRYRFICFLAEGRLVVCTSVLLKKSQKTPKHVVAHAVEVRRRYREAAAAGELKFLGK